MQKYLQDKLYIMTLIDGSPAAQRGYSGEIYVLEFGEWNIECNEDVRQYNEALRGKSKTLIFMKDGSIYKEFFENSIGGQFGLKQVTAEERQSVINQYRKWKLEHYRMPATLCSEHNWKSKTPMNPVFFAPTDIQPGDLSEELKNRLEASRHLIVICSPDSARSEWVGKEIAYFHSLGRTRNICFTLYNQRVQQLSNRTIVINGIETTSDDKGKVDVIVPIPDQQTVYHLTSPTLTLLDTLKDAKCGSNDAVFAK